MSSLIRRAIAGSRALPGIPSSAINSSHVSIGGAMAAQVRTKWTNAPDRREHKKYGSCRVRGRYYYRFHKMIGKANWQRYVERFVAPKKPDQAPTAFPSWPGLRSTRVLICPETLGHSFGHSNCHGHCSKAAVPGTGHFFVSPGS